MVTRRTVLTAAAVGAAAGAAAMAAPASAVLYQDGGAGAPTGRSSASSTSSASGMAASGTAEPATIPRTVSSTRAVTNGRLRVTRTDFKLSHLGVLFEGNSAQVRVRTADGWGAWSTLSACGGGPDAAPAGGTGVLVVPGADGYDIQSDGPATVVELNTVDGPAVGLAASLQSTMPLPFGVSVAVPYFSRAAWGATESYRFRNGVEYWPTEFYPVQTLTVHHQGGSVDSNPAATVRAIYKIQAIDKDWGDIGYQLLIDGQGRVYEGRYSGPDPSPVYGPDPGPDGRPMMSVGGHVKGYNAGNIGVCLLGNLDLAQPTDAAVNSLTKVLTAMSWLGGLKPLGTTAYVDPASGLSHSGNTISGHRNWAPTECPGDNLYSKLGSIRSTVAQAMPLAPPGVSVWPQLSPRVPDSSTPVHRP